MVHDCFSRLFWIIISFRLPKTGGGRKPHWVSNPETDVRFPSVLRDHTAGDPTDAKVLWTNLREKEIVKALQNEYGVEVSRNVVRQLLKKHGCRLRKAQKRKSIDLLQNCLFFSSVRFSPFSKFSGSLVFPVVAYFAYFSNKTSRYTMSCFSLIKQKDEYHNLFKLKKQLTLSVIAANFRLYYKL